MSTWRTRLITAPFALTIGMTLSISAQTVMMTVAMVAASPVSSVPHPANTLVMGSGECRFADYLKLAIPPTWAVF